MPHPPLRQQLDDLQQEVDSIRTIVERLLSQVDLLNDVVRIQVALNPVQGTVAELDLQGVDHSYAQPPSPPALHHVLAAECAATGLASLLSQITNHAGVGVVVTDSSRHIIWVNEGFSQLCGYSAQELIGQHPGALLHGPLTDPASVRLIHNALKAGNPISSEVLNYHKLGVPYWVALTILPILNQGKVTHFVGLAITVTQRKDAEISFHWAQELVTSVFSNSPLPITITSLSDSRHIAVNQAYLDLIGYSREEVLGKTAQELGIWYNPADRARLIEVLQATGKVRGMEIQIRSRSGDMHSVLISIDVIEHGNERYALALSYDITARKRAEQQVQESEARLRTIVDTLQQWVVLVDTNYTITAFNRYAREDAGAYFQITMQIGHSLLTFVPAEYQAVFMQNIQRAFQGEAIGSEQRTWFENELYWYRFEYIPVHHDDGTISAVAFLARDISQLRREEAERLELERQVQQARRQESLQMLSGGIAHDFNNLLAIILGNAELAQADLPADSLAHESLTPLIAAARRAAGLTQQLLAYTDLSAAEYSTIDLGVLIIDILPELLVTIPPQIRLQCEPVLAPLPVLGSVEQLQQLFAQLVSNAVEAIGAEPGQITITSQICQFDANDLAGLVANGPLAVGRYVVIDVADSGPGMDMPTQARIFEPFFTTRFSGRGLGLAVVFGIVRAHNGGLQVSSTLGQGSRFRIALPTAQASAEPG